MLAMLIAAAALPADAVAPPLDVLIHQTSEEIRDDGRGARSFRIARDVTFAGEADGFRATVTLRSAEADASPDERRRYQIANAPLIGRPIVFHLDRAGAVRAIDDFDAVFADWARGLAGVAPEGQDAQADALRQRLYGLSAEQRRAVIGSIATSLFAAPAERVTAAPKPVSMTSPAPFADVTMTGTTSALADPRGIRIRTAASGRAPASATTTAASVAMTLDRLIDSASGLILSDIRRETLSGRGARLTVTASNKLTW